MNDVAQKIGPDVPCFGCGYDMRGLPTDGRCPECGRTVDDSIRAHRRRVERYGPALQRKDARWVAFVLGGYLLFAAGATLMGSFPEFAPRDAGGYPTRWAWVMVFSAMQAMWIGLWGLTRPPRAQPKRQQILRRAVRVLATVWLIADYVYLAVKFKAPTGPYGPWVVGFASLWAAALCSMFAYAYLAQLSARLRCAWLACACMGMAVGSTLLLVAVAQKTWGVYRPHIGPITLPFPHEPLTGSVQDFWAFQAIRREWGNAGPPIMTLLDEGPGLAWLIASAVTLSWFAIALFVTSAKSRGRSAASSRP